MMQLPERSIICMITIVVILMAGCVPPHSLEQPQPLVNDGAWCWFSDPRAVRNTVDDNEVFYGWINSIGDVRIGSYDLETKESVEYTLHDTLEIDDHNVPSILILPSGEILAFYNEHNGDVFMRRSRNPGDITQWYDERVILHADSNYSYTYTNPVRLSEENGRIYLFGRVVGPTRSFDNWWPYYIYSDDDGQTWSGRKIFLDNGGRKDPPYLKICTNHRDRIDFVFTDGHPKIGEDVSVYHMFYSNGTFFQTDGETIADIGQQVLIQDVEKVYDGTNGPVRSWIWDVALDQQGNPVVAYARFPDENDHRYHYARWDGGKWMDSAICRSGNAMPRLRQGDVVREAHYSGGMALDHAHPENLYISRENLGRFEIQHILIEKNGSYRTNWLTRDSELDNVRPCVVYNPDGNTSLLMWVYGTYHHYTEYNTEIKYLDLKALQ